MCFLLTSMRASLFLQYVLSLRRALTTCALIPPLFLQHFFTSGCQFLFGVGQTDYPLHVRCKCRITTCRYLISEPVFHDSGKYFWVLRHCSYQNSFGALADSQTKIYTLQKCNNIKTKLIKVSNIKRLS